MNDFLSRQVHQSKVSADDRVDPRRGGDGVRRWLAAEGTADDRALVPEQRGKRSSLPRLRGRLLRDRSSLSVPVDG